MISHNDLSKAISILKDLKPVLRPVTGEGRKYKIWVSDKQGGWVDNNDPRFMGLLLDEVELDERSGG